MWAVISNAVYLLLPARAEVGGMLLYTKILQTIQQVIGKNMQPSFILFGMISLHWKLLPSPTQLQDQIQYKLTFIVLAKGAQSLARKYPSMWICVVSLFIIVSYSVHNNLHSLLFLQVW